MRIPVPRLLLALNSRLDLAPRYVLVAIAAAAWQTMAFASQPLLNAQKIGAGGYHYCAIVNGAAQCWGENLNGALGNGSFLDSALPVPVQGLGSGVTAIAGGYEHTCAIVNGGVQCWGFNVDGELGNGTTNESATPVAVLGLTSGVIAIAAGAYHTCAVLSGGTVRCWGFNSNGQLGNNTTNSTGAAGPVAVSNISSGATALAGGGYHTCAIVTGAVQCWGYNSEGELDNGSTSDSHIPVAAAGLGSAVSAIAAGAYHTCAIVSAAIRCWGYNSKGQLGNNTTTATGIGTPVTVSNIAAGTTAITVGGYSSCAVVNGGVQCWGSNVFGQLGIGSLLEKHVPVAVTGLASNVSAIAAGVYSVCAQVTVSSVNQTKCWGDNVDGEIGQGDVINQYRPVAVNGITSGATALAQGTEGSQSCAIVSGAAKCWGDNEDGQLGNGTTTSSSVPVAVTGLTSGVTAIGTGAYFSCAVVSGKAKCWGSNQYGQLGNGSTTNSSTPVTAIASGVTAIATSYWHTCAIVGSAVKCWGNNPDGELGNASTSASTTPVSVQGLGGTPVAISAGSAHTCVVLSNGKIQCWGYNSNGQLGNGTTTTTFANPPVMVSNIASGATAIAAGGYFTCAIVNGGVKCWGDGQVGALGNSQAMDSYVPVGVTGLSSGVGKIAAGDGQACAIVGGAASCWGAGYEGQLGNGSPYVYDHPIAVSGLSANVTALGAGYSQTCAIVSGAVKCWGGDYFGQLGDGRTIFFETPVAVVAADEIFKNGFEAY